MEETLATLRHDLNCLSDQNKFTRKGALQRLQNNLFGSNNKLSESIIDLLNSSQGRRTVLLPIVNCIEDTLGKCRELSIEILKAIVSDLPNLCIASAEDMGLLRFLMPVLLNRFSQNQLQTFKEDQEEIRLQLIELLALCIKFAGVSVHPFIGDIGLVLQRSLKDNYSEVKTNSVKCITNLCNSVPVDDGTLKLHSPAICTALLLSALHKHSSVRKSMLVGLSVILPRDPKPCLDSALPILKKLVSDLNWSVRRLTISIVSDWLRNMPDRVSFYRQLLPLILQGLGDEIEEIQELTSTELGSISNQYEEEYQDELDEIMKFGDSDPVSCELLPTTNGCVSMPYRPRIGIRHFVKRQIFEMLPTILREMKGTIGLETRQKAVKLLYITIRHAETAVIQHTGSIIESIIDRLIDDEDKIVCAQCLLIAGLLGVYVPITVPMEFLLPKISGSLGVSIEERRASLQILNSIVSGSKLLDFSPINDHLEPLLLFFFQHDVFSTEDSILRTLLTEFLTTVLTTVTCNVLTDKLKIAFIAVMCMYSMYGSDSMKKVDEDLLPVISRVSGGDTMLYETFTPQLVHNMVEKGVLYSYGEGKEEKSVPCAKPIEWIANSLELSLFCTVLEKAVKTELEMTGIFGDIIPAISVRCEGKITHDLVLQKLLSLLEDMVSTAHLDNVLFCTCRSNDLLTKIVLPVVRWQPGGMASICRKSCVGILLGMCKRELLSCDQLRSQKNELTNALDNCLDDNDIDTRFKALDVIRLLCQHCSDDFNTEELLLEVLKRLDDSNDPLRIQAMSLIEIMIQGTQAPSIIRSLVLHMDDINVNVQNAACNTLIGLGKKYKDVVIDEVTKAISVHRSSEFCDQVLSTLQ